MFSIVVICAAVAGSAFCVLQAATLASDPGAAKSQVCRPSYLLLENSLESRSTQAARTTLAIVGCESALKQVPDKQWAEIEELLRARSKKAQWNGLITETEREWARRRIADVLRRSENFDIFYYSSPD
jgi:hypothetical protein